MQNKPLHLSQAKKLATISLGKQKHNEEIVKKTKENEKAVAVVEDAISV
jgi:hypothetical protein